MTYLVNGEGYQISIFQPKGWKYTCGPDGLALSPLNKESWG